ncbi:hypothetical protein QE152_g35219 [Popillia japonica]|uniref:Uncharacterized protein n=1 Tax=Popillia japonica TaxID=7064 RepID=A0AAW1IFM0_POPJA
MIYGSACRSGASICFLNFRPRPRPSFKLNRKMRDEDATLRVYRKLAKLKSIFREAPGVEMVSWMGAYGDGGGEAMMLLMTFIKYNPKKQ